MSSKINTKLIDDKISEYLDRAIEVAKKHNNTTSPTVVEIAKMIQMEELSQTNK